MQPETCIRHRRQHTGPLCDLRQGCPFRLGGTSSTHVYSRPCAFAFGAHHPDRLQPTDGVSNGRAPSPADCAFPSQTGKQHLYCSILDSERRRRWRLLLLLQKLSIDFGFRSTFAGGDIIGWCAVSPPD